MSAIGNNNFYENKQCEQHKDLYEKLSQSEKSILTRKRELIFIKTLPQQRTIQRKEKILSES
jgi:hypothetical protein